MAETLSPVTQVQDSDHGNEELELKKRTPIQDVLKSVEKKWGLINLPILPAYLNPRRDELQ